MPQNKRMQLTKLRAAPVLQAEVPPCAPAGRDGRGHRFAADPQCWTDHAGGSETRRPEGAAVTWAIWGFPELIILVMMWLMFMVFGTLGPDRMPGSVAISWIGILGVVAGIATGFAVPTRLLPQGPFLGVSVVALPVLLGGVAELLGRSDARANRRRSHLATWYGGALLGLGLAAGRLGAMRHLGIV